MVDIEDQDYYRERRHRSHKRRNPNPTRDESLRIRPKRCFMNNVDRAPLSWENIVTLRKISRDWTFSNGLWSNRRKTLDSRSQEWKQLVNWLLSSSVRYQTMGILIQVALPPYIESAPPTSLFNEDIAPISAIESIASSRWCKEVEYNDKYQLIATLHPVMESIPFILGLYQQPDPNAFEARFPVGSYMTTLSMWTMNMCIRVHMFRQ
jgi:hypothetical protein